MMTVHQLYLSVLNIHDIYVNTQIPLSIFYSQPKDQVQVYADMDILFNE